MSAEFESISTGVAAHVGRYADDLPAYAAVRSKVITHKPVFVLAIIPALVWPSIRVEIEVTAVRRPGS